MKWAWPWFILSKQIEHVTILLLAEDGDGETGRDLLTPRLEAFRAFHHDLYPGSTIDDEITGNLNPMYVYMYLYI